MTLFLLCDLWVIASRPRFSLVSGFQGGGYFNRKTMYEHIYICISYSKSATTKSAEKAPIYNGPKQLLIALFSSKKTIAIIGNNARL